MWDKKERDNFFIEWQKRKNKRKAIPPSNVGKNSRLGLGIEVGLEYETPIGLIINFPCFRFSTHPTEHGAVIAIGYNLGKFCKGGCRSQDLNLVRQAKRL